MRVSLGPGYLNGLKLDGLSAASVWWVFNVIFTNGIIPYTALGTSFVKLLQVFFGVQLPSITGISLSPTLIVFSLFGVGAGIIVAAWYSERR